MVKGCRCLLLLVNKTHSRNINQKLTTPHYHQANGRVERVIRTIRDMLKRTPGPVKTKLSKIIDAYNDAKHHGIGMSPNKGLLIININAVLEKTKYYRKEF